MCEHVLRDFDNYLPMSKETVYSYAADLNYYMNLVVYLDNRFRLVFGNDSNDDVLTCTAKAESFEALQKKVAKYVEAVSGIVDIFGNNVTTFVDGAFTKYSRT